MLEKKQSKQFSAILQEIFSLDVMLSYGTQKNKQRMSISVVKNHNDISRKFEIPSKENKKDIIKIIDDEEKEKEILDDDIKQVTVKMDGFDRIFLEQYQKILADYQRFLNEYLNSNANSVFVSKYGYQQDTEKKKEFHWGNEVVSNLEMFDVARRIMMNAAMGSGLIAAYTGNNSVNHHEREDFEMWKNASKFNLLLSFLLYEKATNGG